MLSLRNGQLNQDYNERSGTRQGCLLSPLIQHRTGSPGHSNQTRRNKRQSSLKGRSKTVIICRWPDTVHREPQRFHQETTGTDKLIQESSKIQN